MRCRDVMKTDVQIVGPTASVADVARVMRSNNIGFVPVCDDEGRPIGCVTDRDLVVRGLAEERPADTEVAEVMTSGPLVELSANDSIEEAEERMMTGRVSRVLVVEEDGCLAGVLSLSDIADVEVDERAAAAFRTITHRDDHV